MIRSLKYLLLPAALILSSAASQAQLSLPGRTLKLSKPSSRAGKIIQPAKNPKNVLKGPVTPVCPFLGMTLRQLMVYSRANCPDLYRQAVLQRRTGSTQNQVRQFLEDELCAKWEASLP